jgi:hypothetical protein
MNPAFRISNLLIALVLLCMPLQACTNAPASLTGAQPLSSSWQPGDGVSILNLTSQAEIITFPATINGLKAVSNGAPNTFVYLEQSGNYLLGWPQGQQWAIVELTPDGFFARNLGDMYRAGKIDPTDLTTTLNNAGGQMVSYKDLPALAVSALSGLIEWAATAMMDLIPVIIVMPPLDGEFNLVGQG